MTKLVVDEVEWGQMNHTISKLAKENKQLKDNTRIDTLECEIAKLEIQNRELKLKIQDLQREKDGYEMEAILNV